MRRPLQTLTALFKALLLVGCNLTGIRDSLPSPTLEPTAPAAEGWELVMPGLERRYLQPEGLGGLAGVVHGEPGPQMRDACEVLGLCPGAPIPAQATLHEPNLPAPEPKLTHL